MVRQVAGGTALLLALTACVPEPAPPVDGEPPTIVVDEEEPPPADGAPPDGESGPPPSAPPSGPDGTGSPDGPAAPEPSDAPTAPDQPAAAIADRGPLGSACRPYLRGEVPALTIEVLHQPGARPSADALDHLLSNLRPVLDKPQGIELSGPREIPGEPRTWRLDELRALAADHRRTASSASRASMLVLSVAGGFEDAGVLGLAMNATEIVLFPQQIGDLTTSLLGGSSRIERAVLLHEAGHLLCLVDIGYRSELDHEDPDHPHHSRHRDSVMFWAIPNDAVTQVFSGPPPDRFHADDLADLQGLRDGRY